MLRKKHLILFAVFFIFASSVAAQTKPIKDLQPTIILISLDGFHPDYLNRYKPPVLNKLAAEGVRAKWMIPSFPTKTFPNHYTVATGLYPDNHGIIENNMYDAETGAVFGLDKREEVTNPRWWGGEPIWVTAEKQRQIAAAFFFPGTETPIQGNLPTFWKKYEHTLPNEQRVDTVLSWLDLSKEKRPTIFTMYFSDVDDAGHASSPYSEATKAAVLKVDGNIGRLMEGLRARKIDKKVNLIIFSDHGMQPYLPRDAIILDEMFDTESAERIFWIGEFTQIFPKEGKEDEIYNAIKAKLPPTADVYRRDEFPARYNFGKNKRIAPVTVVPKPGAIIMNRKRYKEMEKLGTLDIMRGTHGYDNAAVSMRALFVAHGEAFKKGFVAEPFENVNVYNIMCDILSLKPAKNDGNFSVVRGILKNPRLKILPKIVIPD